MDLQLMKKTLELTPRKKKWVILLAAFGATSYGIYRVYNLPSITEKRKRFSRVISALISIVEATSYSVETFGILSKDVRDFLKSDSDEIPNSFKQISKLVQSKEFSDCAVNITSAFTRGVFRGYQVESCKNDSSNSGFYDRFMDKLFSESGSGFASVVVGSFARNLVLAFYSNEVSNGSDSGNRGNLGGSDLDEGSLPKWVDLMCSSPCKVLIGDCIHKFVSTAVAIYLEKTMNINTYDELFSGLTNPKHDKEMKDLLVSLCNGSIETFVKTSHKVLTSSNEGEKIRSHSSDISRIVVSQSNSDVGLSKTLCSVIDDDRNVITVKQNGYGKGGFFDIGESRKSSSSDWMSTMSSTLAVPSNRKLVLDVTGRVTFETVRSFLEFLMGKLSFTMKRSARVVNDAIMDSGREVVRYVTAKYYVVASICISLCLHMLGSSWELMPA